MRDDVQADFDRGHRTLAEMTPALRWRHRLGAWLLIASAVFVVTFMAALVSAPAVALWSWVFGR
jgi:hypothetical protein